MFDDDVIKKTHILILHSDILTSCTQNTIIISATTKQQEYVNQSSLNRATFFNNNGSILFQPKFLITPKM